MNGIERGNLESNIEFIKKTKILNKKQKILEIGSGKGSMLNYLYLKKYKIIGIELNEKYIQFAKKIYGEKLPLKFMSGDKLKFKDNEFDIVLSFDVFEHIEDTNKHLKEIKRILKNNGKYLLCTPNKFTNIPWEIINTKSLTKWKTYHCSLHSYKQLSQIFRKFNFDINFIDIKILNEFTINKIKNKIGIIGIFLFKILNPDKFPLRFRTNFYLIAKNKK